MTTPARVLVANSSPLLGAVLTRALHGDDIDVVGVASSCTDAVDQSQSARPNVVVTSSTFADAPLAHGLRDLLASGTRVLVVCKAPSPAMLMNLLFAGVSGYLFIEDVSVDELVTGVLTVAAGDAALHPSAAAAVLQQWRSLRHASPRVDVAPRTDLTAREMEVLTAMAEGLATKAIALRLDVALKTVENHKARVFGKLGARNHAHAVTLAIEQGLLSPSSQLVGESRS
ncbi:MAG: response regulator transcription factor [Acidimicrobiales bacterium]